MQKIPLTSREWFWPTIILVCVFLVSVGGGYASAAIRQERQIKLYRECLVLQHKLAQEDKNGYTVNLYCKL